MRKVTLLGFICLALMLVPLPFAACAEEAPAPVTPAAPVVAPAAPAEPMFSVLDPRGWMPDIEVTGLNPRLDTLEGKNIVVVNMHGGNEEAIISVGPDLQAAVPGCNVTSFDTEGIWSLTSDETAWILENFDAAILGHNF